MTQPQTKQSSASGTSRRVVREVVQPPFVGGSWMYNTIGLEGEVPEGWVVVHTGPNNRLIKFTEREDPFWATSAS